jgi:hypothetical protein
MRLEEFANAQDQLDLWKLVSDAVWAGINTQDQQQAQVAAHPKAQPKSRAKGAKGSTAKPIKIPVSPAPPKPVPASQQKPAQAAAIAKSKGQVATPAAAPIKPGFTAAQAPRVFGQSVVRTVTPLGTRPSAPARPLTPQQRWLNRRPWGPPTATNGNQMPQTGLKSRPLPQK